MTRLRSQCLGDWRLGFAGSDEIWRHVPALVLQKSADSKHGKSGRDHSPAQHGSSQPVTPRRKRRASRLGGDRGGQSQGQNVAAVVATGQVFRYHRALGFRQSALGESREHVRVRMSSGRPRRLQPLPHDIGKFWHFIF
jgi:hypothetical protein